MKMKINRLAAMKLDKLLALKADVIRTIEVLDMVEKINPFVDIIFGMITAGALDIPATIMAVVIATMILTVIVITGIVKAGKTAELAIIEDIIDLKMK